MDCAALYYDLELYPSMKEQKNFEKNVFNKTHKADNEIAFVEGMTVVYKSSIDLFFYVVGSPQENELMLMAVLNCLFDSLSQMLRKSVEKRTLLDNMDGVFLVVDEIIDGGVILESDPQQVIEKVNYRTDDSPLSEQSVAQGVQRNTWSVEAIQNPRVPHAPFQINTRVRLARRDPPSAQTESTENKCRSPKQINPCAIQCSPARREPVGDGSTGREKHDSSSRRSSQQKGIQGHRLALLAACAVGAWHLGGRDSAHPDEKTLNACGGFPAHAKALLLGLNGDLSRDDSEKACDLTDDITYSSKPEMADAEQNGVLGESLQLS
ncbi:Coatomer subunit zeta-1 [Triplophysa tibetana]|uniref:Coatomer subunit zeta n=1 Tax=Triplophysa tibetana TaxID=1572043 RepID=A0A5A9NB20_9TELE|nr:Coatomer subunit zeta-1 [Triplophysa tibetana]